MDDFVVPLPAFNRNREETSVAESYVEVDESLRNKDTRDDGDECYRTPEDEDPFSQEEDDGERENQQGEEAETPCDEVSDLASQWSAAGRRRGKEQYFAAVLFSLREEDPADVWKGGRRETSALHCLRLGMQSAYRSRDGSNECALQTAPRADG